MSEPSPRKMLDHLFAEDLQKHPSSSRGERYGRIARDTGLGRTTILNIANGSVTHLVRDSKRSGLFKAYNKIVARKGDSFHQGREDRVYSASLREIDQEYGPLAEVYLDRVHNEALSVTTRILNGVIGQKVVFNWLTELRDKSNFKFVPTYFNTPQSELIRKGHKALEALQSMLNENERAPEGLFPDAKGKRVLTARSYRLLRARFRSDFIGWQFIFEDDISKRAQRLKDAYDKTEISRDFQWMHKIEPSEIAWLYNPFMVALHAEDWTESVRLLKELLSQYPDFLTHSKSDLKSLADDPDAIPGLAAVLVQKNNPSYDHIRAKLDDLRIETPSLAVALDECAVEIAKKNPTSKYTPLRKMLWRITNETSCIFRSRLLTTLM